MRVVMVVALGVPQVAIGLWAIAAPQGWFESFPGIGPALVAAEPPFNRHLASDVGAGFFAIGVVMVVAAGLARRSAVFVALAGYAAFTIPHVLYHGTHAAPGLTVGENALNVGLLASTLVWAAVAAWGVRRHRVEPAA